MALSIIGSNGLDHPHVQKVIEIAEEIINQNKPLTTEILYNTAKKRLDLSRRGLLSVIQLLFNKKILVEGSKYTKESILSNQYRENIYRFIRTNIGAHFSLIRKEMVSIKGSMESSGRLIWNLEMLMKFKFIKKVKLKNYSIFLPIEIDDEIGKLHFILRDELNKKIIILFINQEKVNKADIYKVLNEPREHVYYRINILIDYELLTSAEKEPEDLFLTPNKKELIKEILNKISL